MSKSLFDNAWGIISARTLFETDQKAFYTMRLRGLPRQNKPFQGCADGHVPIIDNAIRKQKPYYHGQVTNGERLFNFTSLKEQVEAFSDAAADYTNFEMFNRSNFKSEIRHTEDAMLLRGRGVMKSTIDPLDGYKLVFEAIDPLFILIAQEANDFEDADEFVHVRQMSVETYRRLDKRWDTKKETVEKIRGQPVANLSLLVEQKRLSEGITFTTNKNQIILFEHWVKTVGGWTIHYYSPHAPDLKLRQSHGCPYKVKGKPSCCYFSVPFEAKDKGWYASRGLGELLAPWEQFATKIVNEKADAMTFANRPLYTGEKEIINANNYRWQPGEYIPGNIESIKQAAPPMSFDEMLNFTRSMAEEVAQSPDFGITEDGGGQKRTATENNRIAALQQTGLSYSGDLFQEFLGKLGVHVWGLICQFKSREFSYYAAGSVGTLPEQSMHDQYLITPDCSPEGWNLNAQRQKAVGMIQTFANNPNVDMEILTKNALNKFDGKLALKAFVPTGLKDQNEAEEQAMEIQLLIAQPPYPAKPLPSQNQLVRIQTILQWLMAAHQLNKPLDPSAKGMLMQNMSQRMEILKQQNPQAHKQAMQLVQQMEAMGAQPAPAQIQQPATV